LLVRVRSNDTHSTAATQYRYSPNMKGGCDRNIGIIEYESGTCETRHGE